MNAGAALAEITPQIAAFGRWLLATVAELGLGLLQFVLAIVIAGVFLANAQGGGQTARAIATRLAGERGAEYAELGQATLRSVARGILGVALIQCFSPVSASSPSASPAPDSWRWFVYFSPWCRLVPPWC